MTLELNYRMICRRTGEMALLFDRDTRKVVSLNSTGLQIYELLKKESDCEKVLTAFAGDDPEKRADAEKFLAMLQQSGCLAGFSGDTVSAVPPPKSAAGINQDIGIGFSMLGTFENGDKLEVKKCDFSRLRRGDVIRFINREGIMVGHRIIGGKNGRFVTMGDNNDHPDRHFVTAANEPVLITGKVHHGRYYPIRGGEAGMRHFYFLRVRRACRRGVRRCLKLLVLPLLKGFFWRRTPDRVTKFGNTRQFSCRGKVIGWRINGNAVYAGHLLRLFYRLPEF